MVLQKICRMKTLGRKMVFFIALLCSFLIVMALFDSLLMWRHLHTASRIEPPALLSLQSSGEGVPVILDVRLDWEYQHDHVPATRRHLYYAKAASKSSATTAASVRSMMPSYAYGAR
jgi:hypothetical protein